MASTQGTVKSTTIPFPVGGWNTKDPRDGMSALYALTLDNIIPREQYGELRKGYALFSTISAGKDIQTLAEYAKNDGTRQLLAACDGKIYTVTSGAKTDKTGGASITVNKWQTVTCRGKLLWFNGTDQPLQWDGTNLTSAAYTGIADDAVLVQATVFRNRLYAVQKDTTSIWYGGINAVTGAVTEFDVGSLLVRGGYVQAVTTWTSETGTFYSESLVIISSEGEVLIYSGTSPDQDGFSLSGHVFLSKPIGRRCFLQNGTDVEIITQLGVVPLSKALAMVRADNEINTLTDKISPTFRQYSKLYKSVYGWQGVVYNAGGLAIYNVPLAAGSAYQLVRNLYTGAWTRFTGMGATCWVVADDVLYFGASDGIVYQADYADNDNGGNIDYKCKTAFNYFGNRDSEKHFKMARPIVVANNQISFNLGIDVDFQSKTLTNTVTTVKVSGSEWDVADWDTSDWAEEEINVTDWYAIAGIGRCGALRLEGSSKNVAFQITAIQITFDGGGIL